MSKINLFAILTGLAIPAILVAEIKNSNRRLEDTLRDLNDIHITNNFLLSENLRVAKVNSQLLHDRRGGINNAFKANHNNAALPNKQISKRNPSKKKINRKT